MLPPWLILAAACTPDVPAWALDPIHLEPHDGAVEAVQRWQLYDAAYPRNQAARTYVCGAVFSYTAVAADVGCADCTQQWTLTGGLVESDCDAAVWDTATLPVATSVGLSPIGGDLSVGDPYPGISQEAWVGYDGAAPESYGWAFPASLDATGTADGAAWNGRQAFTLWPAWAWDVTAW